MYSCFPQILYSFSLPCGATVMNIYKGIIYIYIYYIYIYIIYIYIYNTFIYIHHSRSTWQTKRIKNLRKTTVHSLDIFFIKRILRSYFF